MKKFYMEPIALKVSEEVKKRLEKLAEKERRSLSNLVRNIILDWLEEQDQKSPPQRSKK